jgi:hypothetical protein
MRLGVYLNSQHPESDDPARCLAETLEQARLIRSLGFDSIWAAGGPCHSRIGVARRPAAEATSPR